MRFNWAAGLFGYRFEIMDETESWHVITVLIKTVEAKISMKIKSFRFKRSITLAL